MAAEDEPDAPTDPPPTPSAPPEDAATEERLEDLFAEDGESP